MLAALPGGTRVGEERARLLPPHLEPMYGEWQDLYRAEAFHSFEHRND